MLKLVDAAPTQHWQEQQRCAQHGFYLHFNLLLMLSLTRSSGSPRCSAMIFPSHPGTGAVLRGFVDVTSYISVRPSIMNFIRCPASWAAVHSLAPAYHVPSLPPLTLETPLPKGTST